MLTGKFDQAVLNLDEAVKCDPLLKEVSETLKENDRTQTP